MSERGNWANQREFVLACIGSIVGLGNVWRFPYVCYINGGGAFLIPYTILLLTCGIPTAFLKMAYCQFSNLTPGRAWICVPLFKGVGYGLTLMTCIIGIYYNVIIAWIVYYMIYSFRSELSWDSCNNTWNTDSCYLRSNVSMSIVDTIANTMANITTNIESNITTDIAVNSSQVKRRTSTEEFWDYQVLERSPGIETVGWIRWPLCLCLLASWFVVFLVLIRGIKSSGKVMYVSATLPYLLLLVLLCRAATLDGAVDGLKFFLIPKWDKLLSLTVWGEAAAQLYFSSGIGSASYGTLASYNKFNNDIHKIASVIPVIDMFSSLFASLVLFMTLGYMAKNTGLSIDVVVSSGPGLAFMAYPEALSQLPLPQFWSVIFFLMLFTVGIDSQWRYCIMGWITTTDKFLILIVFLHMVTGSLVDNNPKLFRNKETILTGLVCVAGFILGLPCVTQGGIYILQLMDRYTPTFAALTLAFMEIIGLTWLYGLDRLYRDISLMLQRSISRIWGIFWKYITPLIILTICSLNISNLKPISYGDVVFPVWAVALGCAISAIPFTTFLITLVVQIYKASGKTLIEKIRNSIKPHKDWGPADENLREMYSTYQSEGQ